MRQILGVILLCVMAWVVVPGLASAHEAGRHSSACAECVDLSDASATEHRMVQDCHNGATCGAFGLLAVSAVTPLPSLPVVSDKRMDDDAMTRSAFLAQDLPPPRALTGTRTGLGEAIRSDDGFTANTPRYSGHAR